MFHHQGGLAHSLPRLAPCPLPLSRPRHVFHLSVPEEDVDRLTERHQALLCVLVSLSHDADFLPELCTAYRHDAAPHRGHNAANPAATLRGQEQKHGPTGNRNRVRSISDSTRMCSANTW